MNPSGAPDARRPATPIWLRVAGALILLLAALPLYRLLDPADTGLAGRATREMAAAFSGLAWSGMLLAAGIALLAARVIEPETVRRFLARVARMITAPPAVPFALALGILAFALTRAFSALVLHDQPNFVDTFAQLVHARYLAEGQLAGPISGDIAFQNIQQMIVTPAGWMSQYPPGHLLVLALGFIIGDVWSAGALMVAVSAAAMALAAERLLPMRRPEARFAAILLALSPMLTAHGGALLSHGTAAALGALALLGLAHALERSTTGALASGLALGALAMTRPLTALALAAAAGFALLGQRGWRRIFVLALACLPGAVLMLRWNAATTGDMFTFGYAFALGEGAGLGWGIDPWGNRFGAVEAVAYVSAELHALSVFLLEMPAQVVAGIGAWLLIARTATAGVRAIALWALVPLAASLLYWHHGLFMGPRMLTDTAAAWVLLAVLAAGTALRAAAQRTWSGVLASYSPLAFALTLFAVLLAAAPVMTLLRYASYRTPPLATTRMVDAAAPDHLIFVHGAWPTRAAMTLAAQGVSLSTIERLIGTQDMCTVHEVAGAPARAGELARAASPPGLQIVAIAPNVTIRHDPSREWTDDCRRQAQADVQGAFEIAPVLWRSALPGLRSDDLPLIARDLGPARNSQFLPGHPARRPAAAVPVSGRLEVLAYEEAMGRLWSR